MTRYCYYRILTPIMGDRWNQKSGTYERITIYKKDEIVECVGIRRGFRNRIKAVKLKSILPEEYNYSRKKWQYINPYDNIRECFKVIRKNSKEFQNYKLLYL